MGHIETYVHALSQIEYHRESGKDLSGWLKSSKETKDHVAVLDGLALLLILRPKGDVAAITTWRSANECKILWAKNQPIGDSKELEYSQQLLQNVKKGYHTDQMLQFVIPMYREK